MNKKIIIFIFCIVFIFSLILCFIIFNEKVEEPISTEAPRVDIGHGYGTLADNVSMINLIANPEKYAGELVRVSGVVNFENEGNALYLTRDDYDNRNFMNALWIDGLYDSLELELGTSYEKMRNLNGEFVTIEGTFWRGNKGAWNLYSGAIGDIKRIYN